MGTLARRLVEPLTKRLLEKGLRQGLVAGSSAWLAVAAVAAVVRLLARPEQPRVVREDLAVGETIVVTHKPAPAEPTRRERRRALRLAIPKQV